MIQVYNSNNKNFDKNGDMSLTPIRCELKAAGINKPIELQLEHEVDKLGRYKYLEKGNVIRCYTPYDKTVGQLFRIEEKDKDSVPGTITVYAIPIFYDNLKTYVKDYSNENILICDTGNTNGDGAIKKILANTPYKGFSDISKISRTRLERKNIIAGLTGTDENSFVNRWGGELHLDNFNVYINNKIGRNTGISITYGRNLKSIKEQSSYAKTVTRIIPIGYDGLRLTGKYPWVDSPNIDKYPTIMEKELKFDNVKVKDSDNQEGFETEEKARAELVRLSEELFKEGIDTPEITIKTEIEDLFKTVEYKDYSCLEEINLGDYIKATHYKLNIDTVIRCEGYTWNVLTEQYINITLGNSLNNFFDKQNEITNKIDEILNNDGTVNAASVDGILNAINVQMKAMREIAQDVPVRALICEDKVKDSPTYGAMCFGSMGFMIAHERTLDNKDWNWRTFGTGKGFFADLIVAGTMLADRIKGGILESVDGSLKLDLTDTTKGIQFQRNGVKAVSINGHKLEFFDWDGIGNSVGQIFSARFGNDNLKTGMAITHDKNSSVSISYKKSDGSYGNYIAFDKDGTLYSNPISVYENMAVYASLSANYLEGVVYVKSNSLRSPDDLDNRLFASGRKWVANKDFHINGNSSVSGTKSCVQKTKKFGDRLFYAVEDGQCFLTETGTDDFTVEETEEGTFERIILINTIFKECVNLDINYNVEIYKTGWGDYRIKEKTKDYFILESDRLDFTFNYCVKAKRKGYENYSLEEYEKTEVIYNDD